MMSPVREGKNDPDLPQRMRAANYLEPDAIWFTTFVIASEAKQSRAVYAHPGLPRRFAPRNDDSNSNHPTLTRRFQPPAGDGGRGRYSWSKLGRRSLRRRLGQFW